MPEEKTAVELYQGFVREVSKGIKDLDGKIDGVKNDIQKLAIDVAVLKVKAGIWGFIGGAIPVAIAILIYFVEKLYK